MELIIDEIEQIPENTSQINVIKDVPKMVKFANQEKQTTKNKLSYDDILSNMGMYVKDGKVHTYSKSSLQKQVQNQGQKQVQNQGQNQGQKQVQNQGQNQGYIYNKYFKEDIKQETIIRVPKNLIEYRNMLIHDILQKERIKRVKHTKILLPNTNINALGRVTDLNKLFKFSQR
jgi:hypothetical protein